MEFIIALLFSLAVLVLVLPERFLPARRQRLRKEFGRLGRQVGQVEKSEGKGPLPLFRLAGRLPTGSLVRLVGSLYSAEYRRRFEERTLFAGLTGRVTWQQFMALKVAVPLFGGLYLLLVYAKNGMDPALIVASPIPVMGFFVPDQWLWGRTRRRQRQIQMELPAVLSTLAVTTEAGLNLQAAMEEVARTQSGALAEAFRWAAEQVALGEAQGTALENMAGRCGVPDLTMFVSTLVQSFEKGAGQVAATLRSQAEEAWVKRRRRAEELAQTASVRLFLPLVLMVFPAVLIFLLGPALITIGEFFMTGVR